MFILCVVSIPQAVSTVATFLVYKLNTTCSQSFNTASGKYCCNSDNTSQSRNNFLQVSIPQAVSTVAT